MIDGGQVSLRFFQVPHILHHDVGKGVYVKMYGAFGGYTRWAVVFLIIFVLFFLLVPGYGGAVAGTGAGVGAY